MPRLRRLPLVPVIVALLLAVATTLGLAWAAAALGSSTPARADAQVQLDRALQPPRHDWAWFVTRHHEPLHRVYIFRIGQRPLLGGPPIVAPTDVLPGWARVPTEGMRVDVHGYGWPLIALTGSRWSPGDTQNFLAITGWNASAGEVWLPVRPWWPGLVVDVFVFAIVWGVVLFAPGAVRRRRRLARGHCPVCNYDLAGNPSRPCPECGWTPPNPAP